MLRMEGGSAAAGTARAEGGDAQVQLGTGRGVSGLAGCAAGLGA